MPLSQIPDLSLKLYRRFRLSRMPDSVLAGEVVPVVLLEDLSRFGERGAETRVCWGTVFQAAVAGELPFAALVNSLRERITVTDVWISSGTGQGLQVNRPTAALAGLVASTNKAFEDFRIPGQPQAAVSSRTIAAALPANRSMWSADVLAATVVHVPIHAELFGGDPGDTGPGGAGSRALMVGGTQANTSLSVSFRWVEGVPEG